MELEDLTDGQQLEGIVPGELVSVVAVQPQGEDVVKVFYETASGVVAQRIFTRTAVEGLAVAHAEGRPFDAAADDFRLVAECQRIKLAGLWDPMIAVTTSDIRPLPHQLRAVYGELLPRGPLRYLLADDPGAGKTIANAVDEAVGGRGGNRHVLLPTRRTSIGCGGKLVRRCRRYVY